MLNNGDAGKVQELRNRGFSISKIGREMNIDRKTVRRYLQEENDRTEPSRSIPQNGTVPIKRDREEFHQATLKGVSGSLVQFLKDELEADKINFEIEKLKDARSQWEERKNWEKREKAEQERIQRLDELRVMEGQRQAAEREEKARIIIQKVKEMVVPFSMRTAVPSYILAVIFGEIEQMLSKTDVLGLAFDELVILAEGVKIRILGQEEIRQALGNHILGIVEEQLRRIVREQNQNFKKFYNESGSKLSYRDFILTELNKFPPERRKEILSLIDFR